MAKIVFTRDTTARRPHADEIHKILKVGVFPTLVVVSPVLSNFWKSATSNPSSYIFAEWQLNAHNQMQRSTETNRLHRRLAHLIEVYNDDEDASPINLLAANNVTTLLANVADNLLAGWNLFSNDKGALTMEYKVSASVKAAICIAESQISYFIDKEKDTRITGLEPFSVDSVTAILKKVKQSCLKR